LHTVDLDAKQARAKQQAREDHDQEVHEKEYCDQPSQKLWLHPENNQTLKSL